MLTPVVKVDETKCTNCHECIAVCPVKYCMDGSGDTISINHDLCIGCGSCIAACTHEARSWLDDSERFFSALKSRERIVAVAAPAVIASYPDSYLRLNGYLKSIGVAAVFDVSFGAELTVKSYLEYAKNAKPKMIIAQPCPAIVTYVQLYKPELLPHLAPADSPMLHTMKMIREYFPIYRDHKIAVLSPCIAKRREFDETGLGDYHGPLSSLAQHLKTESVNLARFPEAPFENPEPERAVLFSMPGGLLATVEREAPALVGRTRKIEGPDLIYPYLDSLPESLSKNVNPFLVDCLNCEYGCNAGPGTSNKGVSPDVLESPIKARKESLTRAYAKKSRLFPHARLRKTIARYWKEGLYARSYEDLSGSVRLKRPSEKEARKIHELMGKFELEDFYNCTSCGYRSCDGMTIAIFNGLNKPENCHHYLMKCMEEEQDSMKRFDRNLHSEISETRSRIDKMHDLIDQLNEETRSQAAALEQSSAAITQVIASINSASTASSRKRSTIDILLANVKKGRGSMDETLRAIGAITKSIDAISETIEIIDGVAKNTNLLSMNAAIEAAHAGDAGRGFSVVAEEIRKLSETTQENSYSISKALSRMIDDIASTSRLSTETDGLIKQINEDIGGVADNMTELISMMSEMASGSGQITTALSELSAISESVKDTYREMSDMIGMVTGSMEKIEKDSSENLAITRASARTGN